jgi:hypothetical protein
MANEAQVAALVKELQRRQAVARQQSIDPGSYGGVPELDKIRTAEQAQDVREQVDLPLEAGPAHMEIAKDVLWPVDALASIGGPVAKGMRSAGNVARGASNVALKPFEIAAERQAAIDLVKDPAKLEPHARALVEGAAEKMSGRIGEQEKTLQELIKGRQGQINPDRVSEIMPQYGAKLAERRGAEIVPGSMGEEVVSQAQNGPVDVDLNSLLRIKRVGDKMKNYGFTDAMNPNTVAKAKDASRVSDIARQQIYQNAPGSEEVLGQMGKDIRLKNYLTGKGGKNPISAMQAAPGTLKSSVLAQIDQAAGTNLAQEGDKIRTASKSLIDPSNLVRPLKMPSELWKIGGRATTRLGSGIQSGLESASNVMNKIPGAQGLVDRSAFSGARDMFQGHMDPEAKPNLQVNTDLNQQGQDQPTREELIRQLQEEMAKRQGR